MCSDLDAAIGSTVNRFHGGSRSPHPRYKNLVSYIWHEVAAKVRRHQINLSDYQELIAQLSSRRIKWANDGKLRLESKKDMRARGLQSPDFADAFCMAHGVHPFESRSYLPYDDSGRAAIARSRGWQYTGNEEDARAKMYGDSGGRPGRGDDGGWPGEGFGGVHGGW